MTIEHGAKSRRAELKRRGLEIIGLIVFLLLMGVVGTWDLEAELITAQVDTRALEVANGR